MWAGRPSWVCGIGAAGRAGMADLLEELSVRGEFEDLVVGIVVAGEPDIAVVVDENAVLVLRPFIALARPAPVAQQIALDVEFQYRRRGLAAAARRRRLHRLLLVVEQGARTMDDPDMIVLVDRDAGDLAENPIVGQRFWPERLDLEARNVLGSCLPGGEPAGDHQRGEPDDAQPVNHGVLSYFFASQRPARLCDRVAGTAARHQPRLRARLQLFLFPYV